MKKTTELKSHHSTNFHNALLTMLLLFTHLVVAQTPPDSEQSVRQAVAVFAEAYVKADTDILNNMLAKNYIHVNGSTGQVINKSQWLNWINSRRIQISKGELIISSYKTKNIELSMYKSMAVVTGVVIAERVEKNQVFKSELRFTNTWIQENGKWLRAAFHDSPINNLKTDK